MATAIYSLAHVHGAELWLLFWLAGLLVYLGVCLALRPNRTRQGFKSVLIGALAAEVVIDITWALIYYRNGTYLNYGIGAMFGLALWIPCLAAAGILVTVRNKRRLFLPPR